MKIKWKIIVTVIGLIVVLTAAVLIFADKEIHSMFYTENRVTLENYSSMGLELLDRTYKGAWDVKNGNLYKGDIQINGNYEVIDQFTNGTKVLATIFQMDTRITTNVEDSSGKRMTGTQASDAVVEQVLHKGEAYVGTADILGRSAQTYYVPIKNNRGEIIGMWFVGIYTNIVAEKINQTMLMILLLSILLLVLGIAVAYILGSRIAKAIRLIQEKIYWMEDGNFKFHFENKLILRKDEIGAMSRSAQHMQEKIAEIINHIQKESEQVKTIADRSLQNMQNVHGSIADISATTEELSAGMEETSASTEEMNASTFEIESEVSHMKDKTLQGDSLALSIKNRATVLKEETEDSKNAVSRINEITSNVSDAVESVVKDSKEMLEFVDKQVLSDYEIFKKTSEQYNHDADEVKDVVGEINQIAEQLFATIKQIRQAIDEITTAAGEGAEGTTDIASKLSDIAVKTDEVLNQSIENQKSAMTLDEMIAFFQL